MQGPEQYLNDLAVTLPCAVDAEANAVLDADHRVFLNYETYYVSSLEARARFVEAPYEFCGRVTDPVTRVRFVPEADSPRREHAGRVFLFSSADAVARFDAAPDDYATPMLTMEPRTD